MKITAFKPMLWTENLQGTIDFYSTVLGFTCHGRDDDWGWASLSLDDVSVMISLPNEHTPYDKIGFSGSLYFTTDNVDVMRSKVGDKARICYDIEDFDYGMREFAIYDNNGYILQFGQEIAANQ